MVDGVVETPDSDAAPPEASREEDVRSIRDIISGIERELNALGIRDAARLVAAAALAVEEAAAPPDALRAAPAWKARDAHFATQPPALGPTGPAELPRAMLFNLWDRR